MIQHLIVAVCGICVFLTYLKVYAMKGQPGGQLLRLLPIPGYLFLSLSVLYMPGLVLWSIFAAGVLSIIEKMMGLGDIYSAAKNAIPPTTADLLKRLKFAPYVLAGLIILYLVTEVHHTVTRPVKREPVQSADTLQSAPGRKEADDAERWEELKNEQP